MDEAKAELTALTADIVAAYVSKNSIQAGDLPKLISETHQALTHAASGKSEPEKPPLVPAVSVKKSVTPDFLISLEDGRKYKSLKRHLSTHGMTPDNYRTKWGLSKDYPMVAANYSAQRSNLAKSLGLGRKAKPDTAPKASSRGKGKAIKPKDETFT